MAGEKDSPLEEMEMEDLEEGLEKGDIELPREVEPTADEIFDLNNLKNFIMGDITWAQLQGMTMDEAYNIAEYGYSLYQEGRFHDARAVFEALVMANPYDPSFHCMLGAVYQELDMKEEAAEEYTTAIELDDEHLHAFVNRGELLLQNGEFDRALDDLKRGIELDPDANNEAGVRARALAWATVRALEELQKLVTTTTATPNQDKDN